MKRMMNLFLSAIMLTVLFWMPAIAEETSPHHISGFVLFGTDYYWRGYSQTENDVNMQGEIDYEHSCGFYAGIWGSNIAGDSYWYDPWLDVEGTEEGNLEIDFWVGYWKELGPIELDLMLIYYHYPGNADSGGGDWSKGSAEADNWEFHIGLAHRFNLPTVPKLSVGYDFSPEYGGEDGTSHHVNAVLELGLPLECLLAVEVGWQDVEGDMQTGTDIWGDTWGVDGKEGYDYTYWRVGLSREFFGFNCDLSYHFANSEDDWFKEWYEGEDVADDELVFAVSYSF